MVHTAGQMCTIMRPRRSFSPWVCNMDIFISVLSSIGFLVCCREIFFPVLVFMTWPQLHPVPEVFVHVDSVATTLERIFPAIGRDGYGQSVFGLYPLQHCFASNSACCTILLFPHFSVALESK